MIQQYSERNMFFLSLSNAYIHLLPQNWNILSFITAEYAGTGFVLKIKIVSSWIVYTQPIISKAGADLLRTHFLPTLEKLKKKTVKIVAEEEMIRSESKADTQEAELQILDEFAVLCRDLYAFYPMLIRYVDNNRYQHCSVD